MLQEKKRLLQLDVRRTQEDTSDQETRSSHEEASSSDQDYSSSDQEAKCPDQESKPQLSSQQEANSSWLKRVMRRNVLRGGGGKQQEGSQEAPGGDGALPGQKPELRVDPGDGQRLTRADMEIKYSI